MYMSRHSFARPLSFPRRALGGALGLLALGVVASAQAAPSDRWVNDSLNTFVRSGPTDGYRIVGAVKSGQKVTLLTTQGTYSQIRTESGESVWIPSRDLQDSPSQFERLPALEQEVLDLRERLGGIEDTWKTRVQGMQETLDSRKTLIDELENQRKALSTELAQAQADLRTARERLGDEKNQLLMDYMVYGGGIAGAGLLLGLLVPALTRGRKRNDRWF